MEDHALFREMLCRLCGEEFGLSIGGEYGSGVDAVSFLGCKRPNLLVLDLCLPGLDGFIVAEAARRVRPDVKILVVSSHLDQHTLFRVDRLGVDGFVDKNSSTMAILRSALTSLLEGRQYFTEAFRVRRAGYHCDPFAVEKVLSEREQQVLQYIGAGASDDEVAAQLQISPPTAQSHRRNISSKLGVSGTRELIVFAQHRGFPIGKGDTTGRA